jgi:hypothetical protein
MSIHALPLYQQKLALTSLTSCSLLVGLARVLTKGYGVHLFSV